MAFNAVLLDKLNQREIPSLNGVRAVSALSVVLYHFDLPWASGPYGVIMFFVLSGFLITWLLLKELEQYDRISIKNFYVRRLLRIVPAFYFFAVVYSALAIISGAHIDWNQVVAGVTYTLNYYLAWTDPIKKSMAHTWSLAVEEQFYLLWPVIFVAFSRRLKNLAVWTAAGIVIVWIYRALLVWNGAGYAYVYHAFDCRMDSLMIGCLLAILVKLDFNFEFLTRHWSRSAVVALGVAGSIAFGNHWGQNLTLSFSYAVTPLLLGLLLLQAIHFSKTPLWSWLNWAPVRCLGLISYPLYLWHVISDNILERLHVPVQLHLWAGLAVSIAMASFSYFVIERPIMTLKPRFAPTIPRPTRPLVSQDAG